MEGKNKEDTDQAIINIIKNMREKITIHDTDRTHRLGKRKLERKLKRKLDPLLSSLQGVMFTSRIFKTKKKL